MSELRRMAAVIFRNDEIIVTPLDVNTIGRGVMRTTPVVLKREVSSAGTIGHEVTQALAAVQGGVPAYRWDDESQPTLWGVLGHTSEGVFVRSARLVLVRQDGAEAVTALVNRRQGLNFLVSDHPGFSAPLRDDEEVGIAVLDAMRFST